MPWPSLNGKLRNHLCQVSFGRRATEVLALCDSGLMVWHRLNPTHATEVLVLFCRCSTPSQMVVLPQGTTKVRTWSGSCKPTRLEWTTGCTSPRSICSATSSRLVKATLTLRMVTSQCNCIASAHGATRTSVLSVVCPVWLVQCCSPNVSCFFARSSCYDFLMALKFYLLS